MAGTELMPSLIGGNTEPDCSKLKNWKGKSRPSSELEPSPRFQRGQMPQWQRGASPITEAWPVVARVPGSPAPIDAGICTVTVEMCPQG